jgi:hypothetical protein
MVIGSVSFLSTGYLQAKRTGAKADSQIRVGKRGHTTFLGVLLGGGRTGFDNTTEGCLLL